MRLVKYIIEGDGNHMIDEVDDIPIIGDIIKKDCAPYLREFSQMTRFYRGTRQLSYSVNYMKPRNDRGPKDTDPDIHEWMDDWSQKKHGWKWRSQGLFTSTYSNATHGYGSDTYLFLPIGKYKYLYHPRVSDIADELPAMEDINRFDIGDKESDPWSYQNGSRFSTLLNRYKDKGLSRYNTSDNIEVVWLCKEFYLIDEQYDTYVMDYVYGGTVPTRFYL